MDLELAGKTALITGASQGIGRGTAKVLAGDGVRCVVTARRRELLEELGDEISAAGGVKPIPVTGDLFEDDAAANIARAATDAVGPIDILVNCAGRSKDPNEPKPPPFDYPDQLWDKEMQLNYRSLRQLTFKLLPDMVARRYGRIINISGKSEPETSSTANPPKAAVHAWAKGLSRRVAKDGVTVNCIPPGKIISEQILKIYSPERLKSYASVDVSLGYLGEPEDVGHLIAYLASPLGGYITGAVIPVDGSFRRYSY